MMDRFWKTTFLLRAVSLLCITALFLCNVPISYSDISEESALRAMSLGVSPSKIFDGGEANKKFMVYSEKAGKSSSSGITIIDDENKVPFGLRKIIQAFEKENFEKHIICEGNHFIITRDDAGLTWLRNYKKNNIPWSWKNQNRILFLNKIVCLTNNCTNMIYLDSNAQLCAYDFSKPEKEPIVLYDEILDKKNPYIVKLDSNKEHLVLL
ncbi:MAG: hypothetical protein ABIB11_04480, partial [Candidatus Omnitrophota bacterium]